VPDYAVPEYTVAAVLAVGCALAVDRWLLHTRLVRTAVFWVTMAIVFGFQCLVDGWLTKLEQPIVTYNPDAVSGIRFPWDIPVEDFLFGFALLLTVLSLWEWARRREGAEEADAESEPTAVRSSDDAAVSP
jgi:lycopene cyclase domain-containing protein